MFLLNKAKNVGGGGRGSGFNGSRFTVQGFRGSGFTVHGSGVHHLTVVCGKGQAL